MWSLQYFQKKIIFIFCPLKHKKTGLKSCYNRPQTFFHKYGPAAQTRTEMIFHIMNMSQDLSVSLSVVGCYVTISDFLATSE